MTPSADRRRTLQLMLAAAAIPILPFGAAEGATPTEEHAMTDPIHDFDFFFGSWRVRHRRRREWLAHNDEWYEFDGTSEVRPVMGGQGNMDDNVLDLPGGAYRAVTLRCFDPKTRNWAIWWLDSRFPDSVGSPMVGRFENGTGTFFGDDSLRGRPIKARFIWSHITPRSVQWEQAFSADGGETWETNWITWFTRTA